MARKGFSLIETLFAIIIMALIVTPIPTLLTTISNSAKAIQSKDLIFRTILETMNLSVYHWDEQSESNDSSRNKILETNSTTFLRITNNVRAYETMSRIFFSKNSETNITRISATSPKDFNDSGEDSISDFDDIDDWDGTKIYFNGVENKMINFTVSFKIFYIEDNTTIGFSDQNSSEVNITINRTSLPDNQTSNLKYIEITAEEDSSKLEDLISFTIHYISVNLGEEPNYENKILE